MRPGLILLTLTSLCVLIVACGDSAPTQTPVILIVTATPLPPTPTTTAPPATATPIPLSEAAYRTAVTSQNRRLLTVLLGLGVETSGPGTLDTGTRALIKASADDLQALADDGEALHPPPAFQASDRDYQEGVRHLVRAATLLREGIDTNSSATVNQAMSELEAGMKQTMAVETRLSSP
jgi:hypothetical protein